MIPQIQNRICGIFIKNKRKSKKVPKKFGSSKISPYLCTRKSEMMRNLLQ